MLRIIDERFSTMGPIQTSSNAVVVFNLESAKKVFEHFGVDFVVALNEETGRFAYCYNYMETERFLSNDKLIKTKEYIDYKCLVTLEDFKTAIESFIGDAYAIDVDLHCASIRIINQNPLNIEAFNNMIEYIELNRSAYIDVIYIN